MAGPVGAALGFANQGLHPRGPWTLVAASRAGTARLRGRPCPRLRPLSSFLPPSFLSPSPPLPPSSLSFCKRFLFVPPGCRQTDGRCINHRRFWARIRLRGGALTPPRWGVGTSVQATQVM